MERLKGFRDVYPDEAERRKKIFHVAERCSEEFSFRKVEFPSLELLDLYRLKSGSDLLNQTFSFIDKGGREVTLTPEATPSVVRMLVARKDIRFPAKWYSFQRYWRYEDPQSGRQREFYQYNADIFGVDSIESDAEIMGLSCYILDSLGLGGKYRLLINDRPLMEMILRSLGVENPLQAFPVLDRIRKIPESELLEALISIGMTQQKADALLSIVGRRYDFGDDPFTSAGIGGSQFDTRFSRIKATWALLKKYTSSSIFLDLSVVRGLGYYTGMVFEAFDSSGSLRSILGGGRYDGLAEIMSGRRVPAVGFGMGDAVLEILLNEHSLLDDPSSGGITVCFTSANIYPYALDACMKLRSMGFRTDIVLSDKSLSAQLKQASSDSAYAVIVGEEEMKKGSLTIRNLKDGIQTVVSILDSEGIKNALK